jgi:SAM-dependent methyltransferase
MQFDFGKNWAEYSEHAINPIRVEQARSEFDTLIAGAGGVSGRSFLDIGFGQGLSLLSAASSGAKAVGIDINPTCEAVLKRNRRFFSDIATVKIPVVIGSILDQSTVRGARDICPDADGYDIVHSWGVLHHTGDMQRAIRNAAALVKPNGYLVLALYNRHWSSRPWLLIKYLYCKSPEMIRTMLVWLLTPVIYFAKWLVTRRSPSNQSRGMDFYYNVVDWVGGYPYEYANKAEVLATMAALGFRCVNFVPSEVPTGCNEFVLRRVGMNTDSDCHVAG